MNNFLQSVTSNISKAVDYVVEKNRKTAMVNRIRVVIKNERENAARAYVALGKYYFEHLRDAENEQTEHLCRSVEESERRMKNAFSKLDEITAPSGVDDNLCADCTDDCDACPYFDGLDDDFQAEPVEKPAPAVPEDAPAEGEDDIAQPPFVNEAHDDAAAEEEQEMADTACAVDSADEAQVPLTAEKAEPEPPAIADTPIPEASEQEEPDPEEDKADEKSDAFPSFDSAAARRSVAATIDIATSVVKDVASMAKDFAASVAGTVSKVAKDSADLLKDAANGSVIHVKHTEVHDTEESTEDHSESTANIVHIFHQDPEEDEIKAQEAAIQEMESRIRKADEKAQEFEAKLHEQDIEQCAKKAEEKESLFEVLAQEAELHERNIERQAWKIEEQEPEFEMGVHHNSSEASNTDSSILEMFSTDEEAADDESDGTLNV